MEMTREQEALNAYLRLLSAKGVTKRVLVQKEFILLRLSLFLSNIPCDGTRYRKAVDEFVDSIDPAEIAAVLPVVREFFPFWVKDIKAIAAMNQAQVFNGSFTTVAASQDELFKYWYDLDRTNLTNNEPEVVESYHQACLSKGLDAAMVRERMRMAKFLLVILRAVTYKQSHTYRQMVDRNLPLFNALGIRHTYLSVAREFYYYWRGDLNQHPATDKNLSEALAA